MKETVTAANRSQSPRGSEPERPGFRRGLSWVGTAAAMVVGLTLVWYARQILLLAFAGILLAVFLHSLTEFASRFTGLPHRWSLGLVLFLLTTLAAVLVWLLGEQIALQASEVMSFLPQSVEELRRQISQYSWGEWLAKQMPRGQNMLADVDVFSRITGVASTAASIFAGIAVILFVGIYVAAEPRLYVDGLTRLAPLSYRARFCTVLETVGYNLRWWLWGQLASMTIVGMLVGLGLWLLDVPQALALGLLAFVLDIVPNVGPVLSAIPGLLLAWTQGGSTFLYGLALYCFVQVLEGYIVLPLIQRRTVSLPPALGLLGILFFGLIGGPMGVVVAAPLLVALMTLVKMFYIEDALGDHSLEVPGEPQG